MHFKLCGVLLLSGLGIGLRFVAMRPETNVPVLIQNKLLKTSSRSTLTERISKFILMIKQDLGSSPMYRKIVRHRTAGTEAQ